MIKKLIGIIVATAVIVIIVIAAIRRDNFQSMVLRDEIEDQTYPEPVASQQPAALAPGETETTASVGRKLCRTAARKRMSGRSKNGRRLFRAAVRLHA